MKPTARIPRSLTIEAEVAYRMAFGPFWRLARDADLKREVAKSDAAATIVRMPDSDDDMLRLVPPFFDALKAPRVQSALERLGAAGERPEVQSLLSPQPRAAVVQPPAPDRPTTIDGLIAWAKWHPCPSGRGGKRHNHSLCEAGQLIIDTLDVALPCGVETPIATADGQVTISDVGGNWSVEDARGIAAAILRAAEAATVGTVKPR